MCVSFLSVSIHFTEAGVFSWVANAAQKQNPNIHPFLHLQVVDVITTLTSFSISETSFCESQTEILPLSNQAVPAVDICTAL